MNIWIGLAVVVCVVLLIGYFRFFRREKSVIYEKKQLFFTPKQRDLFIALQQAVGMDYHIFANVSALDVLRLPQGLDKHNQRIHKQKLRAIRVPFVLCDKQKLSIAAVVVFEPGEREPWDEKALQHMQTLSQACADAGLPLIRFKAQPAYDIQLVEIGVMKVLELPSKPLAEDISPVATSSVVDIALTPVDTGEEDMPQQVSKTCPKCGADMILKKADKGRRAGKYFWTCSTYPVCKRAMPFEEDDSKLAA